MAKRNRFPAGWSEARVKAVLQHYEEQTDEEAVAEDEAVFRARGQTIMVVPQRLVPAEEFGRFKGNLALAVAEALNR